MEKERIYQYKAFLIRYVPDFVSEEFINIGLIMYDMTNNKVFGRVAENPKRLECFEYEAIKNYPVFGQYVRDVVREFYDAIKQTEKAPEDIYVKEIIDDMFQYYQRNGVGSIMFSHVMGGITDNPREEFEAMYERFVKEKKKPDKTVKVKKGEAKEKRILAVTKVYSLLDQMSAELKHDYEEKALYYPLIGGNYLFEVTYNTGRNIYLKVLSLRSKKTHANEIEKILSAIMILDDFKKRHQEHTFGGIIYFSPKYNKEAQNEIFRMISNRFRKAKLDCVKANKQDLMEYFRAKDLLIYS